MEVVLDIYLETQYVFNLEEFEVTLGLDMPSTYNLAHKRLIWLT